MRPPTGALALACLLALAPPCPAAGTEQEQFEEKALARAVERAARAVKSDRALWLKELEAAFPRKVTDATTEEQYATWFGLVAGKDGEWRRDPASPGVAELFDRVVRRLELGPVPSITRDEYARYAKKVLMRENPSADRDAPDPNEDADRAFRVLDRNGDGTLEGDELTTRLKDDRVRADADANGRIEKDEYRAFFARRVAVVVETAAKAGDQPKDQSGKTDPKAGRPEALPAWFAGLDTDGDGQVALSEWRKARKAIEAFQEMDLDGDGLLTRDEYLRYLKKAAKDRAVPPA